MCNLISGIILVFYFLPCRPINKFSIVLYNPTLANLPIFCFLLVFICAIYMLYYFYTYIRFYRVYVLISYHSLPPLFYHFLFICFQCTYFYVLYVTQGPKEDQLYVDWATLVKYA